MSLPDVDQDECTYKRCVSSMEPGRVRTHLWGCDSPRTRRRQKSRAVYLKDGRLATLLQTQTSVPKLA